MATPNFHKKNASRYFCIGRSRYITQEDIDVNDWPQELLGEYDADGTQFDFENCLYMLRENLKNAGYNTDFKYEKIAEKQVWFTFAGCEFCITMSAKINDGHYSGACLDYEASVSAQDRDGYDFYGYDRELHPDSYIDQDWLIDNNACCNNGLTKIMAPAIVKRIDKEFMSLVKELELIFSRCCQDELYLDWICDYGHGIYGEAGYDHYSIRLYEEAA